MLACVWKQPNSDRRLKSLIVGALPLCLGTPHQALSVLSKQPKACPWWARGSGLSGLKVALAEQGDDLFPELKLHFPPKWPFRIHKAVKSRGDLAGQPAGQCWDGGGGSRHCRQHINHGKGMLAKGSREP